MDEEKKSSETKSLLNVLKKKKNTEEKKKEEKKSKDDEALAKVQELLKNTPAAALVGATNEVPVKKEFDMEEHKQERSQKWLEDQVNELNRQVEEYENEIMYYKEEMRKMQDYINSGGVNHQPAGAQPGVIQPNNPIDSSMNHTLTALFKHFENVYERGFTQAKIAHPESGNGILDLLQQYFPQLQQIRRYRYRGPEQQ
jgi:alpha-L-fucosidase